MKSVLLLFSILLTGCDALGSDSGSQVVRYHLEEVHLRSTASFQQYHDKIHYEDVVHHDATCGIQYRTCLLHPFQISDQDSIQILGEKLNDGDGDWTVTVEQINSGDGDYRVIAFDNITQTGWNAIFDENNHPVLLSGFEKSETGIKPGATFLVVKSESLEPRLK